jgi:DNA-binding transcriptional LysR family regulator
MNHPSPELSAFSFSLRHLKVFDSVARLHGFMRASHACHLSQPSVSQIIAMLEKQLGVALVERRASGSYLNEYGMIFHRRVERLFVQIEAALVQLGVPHGKAAIPQVASRITRSHLRSLISIVENRSVAWSARSLGMAQLSLQRVARNLERTLRTPLFMQTASGIMATPAAADFARKLKLAVKEVQWGIDEIEAKRGNSGGEVVIGAMLMAGSVVLASVLTEFAAANPTANIRVLNGNAEDMLGYLRAGDVDFVIGLLREPTPDGLIAEALAETPYVIAARHGHPLADGGGITLDDLADYDWVIGTPGAHRRARFEQLFAGQRKPPARIATCSMPTVRLLLAQGNRLTLLTSQELMFEDDVLTALPYGPIGRAPSIGLTMRRDWLPTQLQSSCLDLIQKRITGSLLMDREITSKLKGMGLQMLEHPATAS